MKLERILENLVRSSVFRSTVMYGSVLPEAEINLSRDVITYYSYKSIK